MTGRCVDVNGTFAFVFYPVLFLALGGAVKRLQTPGAAFQVNSG
jgi:hypothetical protein